VKYDKRILKSGAFAVGATIVFAIFISRAAEWRKGVNSERVVLGQGESPGTTCSTVTKIIPQMPLGSFDKGLTKYTTIIQVVNGTNSDQPIAGNFYKQDGMPLTAALTSGSTPINNGVLNSTSIPAGAVFVIRGGGTSDTGVIGWGKLQSCGGLTIAAFFELRDGRPKMKEVLYSRVGVAPSAPNMKSFVIPRVREVIAGLDVGFAVVNTGLTAAKLTVELKDAAGETVPEGNTTLAFAPGEQRAQLTKDLFPSVAEETGRVYQYLKFTSQSASFAAVGLAFEGANQTSVPVDVLQ
jgi:hypothetical protein